MKLAVVTGASSGIGEAFAKKLSAIGYDLILIGRRKEKLASVAKEVNCEVNVVVCDLSSEEQVRNLADKLSKMPVDLLVNNAGFGSRGYFNQLEIENQVDMIKVHVHASVRFTRAVVPGMINRKKGAVINVSSIAGIIPWKGNATYNSTKAYLNMFSEVLAQEVKKFGIKVQALCPGLVKSEFHEKLDDGRKGYEPKLKKAWLTPDQVAHYSLRKIYRNKVIVIPGIFNKMLIFLLRRKLIFWFFNRNR